MEQVNELIERLMQVGIHFTSPTEKEDMQTIEDTVKFLKSLQPSGNEELDARIKVTVDYHRNHYDHKWQQECFDLLDQAITALSRPVPLDVLEQLKNGEVYQDEDENLFWWIGGFAKTKHPSEEHWKERSALFISRLLNNKLKPYTQPEPELEDGWYLVKEEYAPQFLEEGQWKQAPDRRPYSNQDFKIISRLIEQPEV